MSEMEGPAVMKEREVPCFSNRDRSAYNTGRDTVSCNETKCLVLQGESEECTLPHNLLDESAEAPMSPDKNANNQGW